MAVNINVPSQVKTYTDLAAFPASGALKTIYIAEDTNKTYRWTGSVYVEVSAAGASGITIGTTAITSGTVGRVLFEGTGNVVQESADFSFDSVNSRVLLGRTSSNTAQLLFQYPRLSALNGILWADNLNNPYGYLALDRGSGEMRMFTGSSYFPTFYSSNAERLRIATTGNVLINTTTDAGYKLDVNGNARVTSLFVGDGSSANPSITFYSENGTPNTGIYRIAENELGIAVGGLTWTFNTAEFKKDQIYLRASLGTATAPNYAFGQGYENTGMFRPAGENTVAFSTNGTEKMRINTAGNVGIGTSSPAFRLEVQGGDVRFANGLTIGTAGSTGWQFSSNTVTLIQNGFLGVDVAGGREFSITNTAFSTTYFRVAGTTGNILINTTTDAGYKLDVNGTARVQGALSVTSNIVISAGAGITAPFFNGTVNNFQFGTTAIFLTQTNSVAVASGLRSAFLDSIVWQQSSGTGEFASFRATPTLNTTGTYVGIVRGFHYKPTITSLTGATHYAIHTEAGRVRFENLPTSATGLSAGDIWNDAGTLKIV